MAVDRAVRVGIVGDALTCHFATTSRRPHERVIGTGRMLDTARLRQMISRAFDVAPQSIHAHDVRVAAYEIIALSLPSVVGARGALDVVTPDLGSEERTQLERSAALLREAIGSLP